MTIPTYDKFIEPVLRFLAANPNGVKAKEAHEAAATALNLTNEQKQQVLPNVDQLVYKNRAGWAHDRLKRAGLSSSPMRGYWKLTESGAAFAAVHKDPLTTEEVAKIAFEYLHVKLKPNTGNVEPIIPVAHQANLLGQTESPDDRLEEAMEEIRSAIAIEVRDYLKKVSPSFFETVVLDLLHKLGYGTTRADLQRVGGSGDAGIDGIISLDRLGLEKVYVQAKRWQSTVGRPEIQTFYGALAGQRATKGVFITTSTYTPQAVEFAKSVDQRIVLIDGSKLAELMIDYEVGVISRSIKVPRIDGDYFEEESA
jgi:restriction system protein